MCVCVCVVQSMEERQRLLEAEKKLTVEQYVQAYVVTSIHKPTCMHTNTHTVKCTYTGTVHIQGWAIGGIVATDDDRTLSNPPRSPFLSANLQVSYAHAHVLR